MTVSITAYEQDREIAWTVLGALRPHIGHVYGYRLEPADARGVRGAGWLRWTLDRS